MSSLQSQRHHAAIALVLAAGYVVLSRVLDRNASFRAMHKTCFVSETETKCRFSFWSLTHVLLYAYLAVQCPDICWQILPIGIAWEIGEYYIGIHDFYDIIWNLLGVLIGTAVRAY